MAMDMARKIFPDGYRPKLDVIRTQHGIKLVKDTFEVKIADKLTLHRVSAPRFLKVGKGLQDDLAGTQEPVGFDVRFTDARVEVVHSLAKWKRYALWKYGFRHGTGLYTDMDAIRKDEDVDETHSIYVDQWDWERIISKEERNLDFLRCIVSKIYDAVLETEDVVFKEFPELEPRLEKHISFVHSEDLEDRFPHLAPREREDRIAEELGAVFVIGIGHPLKDGKPHDLRAADYDDWFTETHGGRKGLNGDMIVWDEVRGKALELSSMGIRVDAYSLPRQLEHAGAKHRMELEYHKGVAEGRLPLTIGGGIGQSRLCQLLLQKAHIGEVQSSAWPDEVEEEFRLRGIALL